GEFGAAVGGSVAHDTAGDHQPRSAATRLFGRLRLWPLPWKDTAARLRVAVAYQRTLTAGGLGLEEIPGVETDTVDLRIARALGPVDVDLGIGALLYSLPAG